MTIKANDAVLTGCLELAKKYNVQDVSYRAFVGRIKKVTGIVISTAELIAYHQADDDGMTKSIKAYYGWVEGQVGDSILLNIEREARPFFFHILEMHLLGFIPEEVLVKDIRTNKKMVRECGGVCTIAWGQVVADIKSYQASLKTPKKKSKVSLKTRIAEIAEAQVFIAKSPKDQSTIDTGSKMTLRKLQILGKKFLANEDFEQQLEKPIFIDENEATLYLVWRKGKKEILFGINLDSELHIADE